MDTSETDDDDEFYDCCDDIRVISDQNTLTNPSLKKKA